MPVFVQNRRQDYEQKHQFTAIGNAGRSVADELQRGDEKLQAFIKELKKEKGEELAKAEKE